MASLGKVMMVLRDRISSLDRCVRNLLPKGCVGCYIHFLLLERRGIVRDK